MAEGIEIVIRKQGAPGTEDEGKANDTSTAGARGGKDEPGKPSKLQKQVNALLIQYGKQSIQEGIKLITDYTGDYVTQKKIDMYTNVAADAAIIAATGWVGAIAVGYKYTTQAIEYSINLNRERAKIEAFNSQLGEITKLGGRYSNGN